MRGNPNNIGVRLVRRKGGGRASGLVSQRVDERDLKRPGEGVERSLRNGLVGSLAVGMAYLLIVTMAFGLGAVMLGGLTAVVFAGQDAAVVLGGQGVELRFGIVFGLLLGAAL